MRIRVGVAGWDYPDWNGIVYPQPGPRGPERLAYLARFVDVIEINTSFYRPVDPKVSAAWVRRVAFRPELRFTAKAHRSWTHVSDDATAQDPVSLDGLAPLRDAGILGALLFQFPQSFHRTERALERLDALLARLHGWPCVVELRHISWDDEAAVDWLRARRAGWCVVDQPAIARATAGATPRATSAVGYLRLHGRNAEAWFRQDAGRDARYDYLYSDDELRSLAQVAEAIAIPAAEVFVVQNNHFRGQALANAIQMKHLLDGQRAAAPAALIAAYPALAECALPEPGRLF